MLNILISLLVCLAPVSDAVQDTLSVDIIPDFSRVGYKYGDSPYPDHKVRETITVDRIAKALKKKQYPDTTSFIQAVIDRTAAKGGGTVFFKDGVYNVSNVLFLDKDNVVLRGESREGTVIKSNGTLQRPAIVIGKVPQFKDEDPKKFRSFSGRKFRLSRLAVVGPGGKSTFGKYFLNQWLPATVAPAIKEKVSVSEDYCPVGRMWVEVKDPGLFHTGDAVIIERPHNEAWLHDIGMDRIASNGRSTGPVIQWTNRNFKLRWSRRITAVKGNRIWFDSPLVQSLDKNYGGGYICKYELDRVTGCGVENLTVDSSYDAGIKDEKGVCIDEQHTWYGVVVTARRTASRMT